MEMRSTEGQVKSRQPETVGKADLLYKIYEELSEAEDKAALEDQFKQLLQAVHSGQKEKGLASQFITRFAEHFPHLDMEIANALLDLCEDEDVGLRKQAEKDLSLVAKKLPSLVPTVADAFAQILQTDNLQELNSVNGLLMSLFYVDPEGAMKGVMMQIGIGEPIVRDRCYKFLQSKYKCLGPEVRSPAFEKCLFEEIKKAIKMVETREHFSTIKDILNSTKMVNTEEGQNAIVDLIETMLGINRDFQLSEDVDEDAAKLCLAVDFVFPFFNEKKSSAPLFTYFCTQVLPQMKHFAEINESAYFAILKLTVELVAYVGAMKEGQVKLCLQNLLAMADDLLLDAPSNASDNKEVPVYQFSFIESIFYLINKLACIKPEEFVKMAKPQEQLRSKIAYLLRAAVPYNSKLRKDAQVITLTEQKDKDSLVKLVSFRTLTNVSGLGKVIYKAEGPCLTKIILSWKATLPSSACSSPRVAPPSKRKVTVVKRSRNDEGERDAKRSQESQTQIYQPPNGKFSGSLSYEEDWRSKNFYNRGRSTWGKERHRRSRRY